MKFLVLVAALTLSLSAQADDCEYGDGLTNAQRNAYVRECKQKIAEEKAAKRALKNYELVDVKKDQSEKPKTQASVKLY